MGWKDEYSITQLSPSDQQIMNDVAHGYIQRRPGLGAAGWQSYHPPREINLAPS